MPQARANGIAIEYESFGSPDMPAVLLIMGTGGQLTMWPVELCELLVIRGYRAIRFDNRDVGLSTKLHEAGLPNWYAIEAAREVGGVLPIAYTLDDMARDAVGLLDAVAVDRAHIVGASMGGMIAQLVAADHPRRTLSLTSIMSGANNPALPIVKPEGLQLLADPEPQGDFEALVAHHARIQRLIGSPAYPVDETSLQARIRFDLLRSHYPDGAARQGAAAMTGPDRRPKLRGVQAPTVVLHGADDPLIGPESGRDTADNIPDAELRIVPGMGHDFPPSLAPIFADAITAAARRTTAA